jgi:hypothetical protein
MGEDKHNILIVSIPLNLQYRPHRFIYKLTLRACKERNVPINIPATPAYRLIFPQLVELLNRNVKYEDRAGFF